MNRATVKAAKRRENFYYMLREARSKAKAVCVQSKCTEQRIPTLAEYVMERVIRGNRDPVLQLRRMRAAWPDNHPLLPLWLELEYYGDHGPRGYLEMIDSKADWNAEREFAQATGESIEEEG